jgi:HK97 gp10 family phage protein
MAQTRVGFGELERKLKELEICMRREVLTEAAKTAGAIVLDEAKTRVPRDTGALADSMAVRVNAAQSDANEVTVTVGPSKRGFYGRFVEHGTKNMPAEPFLKPALDNNRDKITKAIKEVMWRAIEKVIR